MELVRKRGSKYWYAECRDATGRRYWKSTKQTDKTAAARVGRRLELEGSVPGLPKYSIAAALLDLKKLKERRGVSAAELQVIREKGGRLIEFFGPGRDLHSIGPVDIDRYVDTRRKAEVRPGKLLSDATIGMELKKLREAAREGKRLGRYGGDPAALRSTVLKGGKPRDQFLTFEQFGRLLSALGDTRDGRARGRARLVDYVLAWCHLGARRGELYRVTAKHIDHRGRRLFIIGHKGSGDHRERWVPLSDAVYEVLTRRAAAVPAGEPLFEEVPGSNLDRIIKAACRRAGVPEVSPNDLRRSYVTWLLTAGSAEREVQKFVGHSPKSNLVRRVYGQLVASAGQEAVATFPGAPPEVAQQVAQTASPIGGQTGASADEPKAESA